VGRVTLTGTDVPVQLKNGRVGAAYFEIFGAKPMLGRTFAMDNEDRVGKENVVVLSHRVWQDRFGEDRNILGRKHTLNGVPHNVIGVMPPGTYDREWQDVWTPLAFKPEEMARDCHWMISWARLKPGVTLDRARENMKSIAGQIELTYPKSNQGWSATVTRYEDTVVDKGLRQSLLVLLAAVGAVLLIGCVNLANLMLVRGAGREREVAVRSVLGAGRVRLVRQFLTESVLLAGFGGAVGVALGWGLMLGLKAWIPPSLLPAEADVTLNGEVLLFAVGIVVPAGISFGIAPVLQSMKADLVGSLKEGGRGGTTGIHRT
jgi:predicted permease